MSYDRAHSSRQKSKIDHVAESLVRWPASGTMLRSLPYLPPGSLLRNAEGGGLRRTRPGSTATLVDSGGQPGEYSTEIPQPARTRADWSARRRKLTSTDTPLWTCCLLMACKRSGVRVSVAPQVRGPLRLCVPRISSMALTSRFALPAVRP